MEDTKQVNVFDLIRKSQELLQEDDFDGALAVLNALDGEAEAGGLICFLRGNVYLRMKDDEQAHANYSEAIKSGYSDAQLYINFGIVKQRLGYVEQAAQMYRQAADLDDTRIEPLDRLLMMRIDEEDAEGAEVVMDEMMERHPELFNGFHHKADLLIESGRPQEALKMLDGVMVRFSANPLFVYDRCKALGRCGKVQEAWDYLSAEEEHFDTTLQVQLFFKEKASLLMKMGRPEEAIPLWEAMYAIIGSRQAGMALATAALTKQDMQKVETITREMLQAEVRDPIRYLAWYYLSMALQSQGRPNEARQEMERAAAEMGEMDYDEMNFNELTLRATLYTETEQYDRALDDLKEMEEWAGSADGSEEESKKLQDKIREMKDTVNGRMNSFI